MSRRRRGAYRRVSCGIWLEHEEKTYIHPIPRVRVGQRAYYVKTIGAWLAVKCNVFIMDLSVSPSDSQESHLRAVENKLKCLEESAHAMKVYRNSLIPISRLHPEILSIIFSLLPSFEVLDLESSPPSSASPVSHVCHRWREISLDLACLWSHINFTKLTPAGTAVMLVRAKTAPLYLEAQTVEWSIEKFKAFTEQIKAHIYHVRHLTITTRKQKYLTMLGQLILAAPSLELLSIGDTEFPISLSPLRIPDNLFDGITPKLTYLRLYRCGISWKSPLLKGLRYLELFSFPPPVQVPFYRWLAALKQMPQLERLVLDDSIPSELVDVSHGLIFTVDFPSLTELSISASVSGCTVVLAHLILPALTRLCVNARINPPVFSPAEHLIQCVTKNAHGPQDAEALQSLFIRGNEKRADIVAWTMPGQDSDDGLRSSIDLPDRACPARLEFSIKNLYSPPGTDIQLYSAMLDALPLNSTASLTVEGRPPLIQEDWRYHASRWHKLERVRLFNDAVPVFRAMFEDVAVLGDPLLPSLEELILVDISLNAQKVYYLCDMLIECVELGIPLKTLNLRTCTASNRAVQLLSEIVVDVRGPVKKESGDLIERRRGSVGVLREEGGRDEDDDGFDGVTSFLGSWDISDSGDDYYGIQFEDEDLILDDE